ncbi:DNA-3-methyladenine glycosidase II [Bordetella ansorpii]|uniref:DNA-3-methyladenine glycosylase II n=1 Tax=Bordetella ansorpii TaxID=288768 RepID=A0A157SG19_9BORD|nr:AlkA N-terminal domain-containing protein [Bordetella ansorpii]SAI69422.1 DNA-3-methyladenine glycosidase II [Bordetella ansorpii]
MNPPIARFAQPLSLPYRPPYAWQGVLGFLAHRHTLGVEHVDNSNYARALEWMHEGAPLTGWLSVAHEPDDGMLSLTLSPGLQPAAQALLGQAMRVFGTQCDPVPVDAHLGEMAVGQPGMRVPGAFDGFEIAVRAIAGQQISVRNARGILARLSQRHGAAVPDAPHGLAHAFPSAQRIARLSLEDVITCGLIRIRAEAILSIAREIEAGRLDLHPRTPRDATLAALRAIRGVGAWTVQYVAMRALNEPDAMPAGDAVLKKRLGMADAKALDAHARRWSPWRAYATVHVWRRDEADKA